MILTLATGRTELAIRDMPQPLHPFCRSNRQVWRRRESTQGCLIGSDVSVGGRDVYRTTRYL